MDQNLAVNEELRSFLRMRGESYGMREPKPTNWVARMSDEQKPKKLPNSIQAELPVSPNEACLDLGCGFGNLVIALSDRFQSVSGIELNPERVEWSKRRCPSAEIVCGTAEKLPWPDNGGGEGGCEGSQAPR
jgi:2-polyprenyl-3-methyl-5-hydroxy-6-metoxy-1,4-benzoquinol methylase